MEIRVGVKRTLFLDNATLVVAVLPALAPPVVAGVVPAPLLPAATTVLPPVAPPVPPAVLLPAACLKHFKVGI